MNTASDNDQFGIITDGNKCTVSYNTASNNGSAGIDAGASFGGTGHLVTHNVTLGNASGSGSFDYGINCPAP